jgi:hypothetical protein
MTYSYEIDHSASGTGAAMRDVEVKLRECYTPQDFGAVADGTTDDATAIENWLDALDAQKIRGYVPAGDYLVSYVRKLDVDHGLDIECHPRATFKGKTTYQTFAGNGSTSQPFTVTAFTAGPSGLRATKVEADGDNVILEENTHFSVSGQVVTLLGATVVGTSERLRVSAVDPIFNLYADLADGSRFAWRGGRFDNSLRGFAPSQSSGSALVIHNFDSYEVEGVEFFGSDDYATAQSSGTNQDIAVSDSGLTVLSCNSGHISKCRFIGQADLGIYITGGADGGDADDGYSHVVSGNSFLACSAGVSAKRRADAVVISDNTFLDCYVGATLYPAGGLLAGRGIVNGNLFRRIGKKAIDIRQQPGSVVQGNLIRDFGYELDGETEVVDASAILLLGCVDTNVSGNTIRMEAWAPAGVGIKLTHDSGEDPDVESDNCSITANLVSGCATACYESGSGVGNIWADNLIVECATPMDVLAARRWSYRASVNDAVEEVHGIGATQFKGSWTPTITFAGSAPASVTYNPQKGRYIRIGDQCTVWLKLQFTATHAFTTQEFRIQGLPFASRNDSDYNAGGSLQYWNSNFPVIASAVQMVPEVPGNSSHIRLKGLLSGANASIVGGSNIASGATIRMDLTITYECEPTPE